MITQKQYEKVKTKLMYGESVTSVYKTSDVSRGTIYKIKRSKDYWHYIGKKKPSNDLVEPLTVDWSEYHGLVYKEYLKSKRKKMDYQKIAYIAMLFAMLVLAATIAKSAGL